MPSARKLLRLGMSRLQMLGLGRSWFSWCFLRKRSDLWYLACNERYLHATAMSGHLSGYTEHFGFIWAIWWSYLPFLLGTCGWCRLERQRTLATCIHRLHIHLACLRACHLHHLQISQHWWLAPFVMLQTRFVNPFVFIINQVYTPIKLLDVRIAAYLGIFRIDRRNAVKMHRMTQ